MPVPKFRLAALEELVSSGDLAAARHALLQFLTGRKIRRDERLKLANLLRRSHWPERAVALLNRTKRSDAETAEYGASLAAMGATREAEKILGEVDEREVPESLLFRAYVRLGEWDWQGAIPLLSRYVATPAIDEMMRLWGKVFLGEAIAQGPRDHARATDLLEGVLARSDRRFPMIARNARWHLAQNDYFHGHFRKSLERLRKIDSGGDALLGDLLALWTALAELGRGRDTASALARLAEARKNFAAARRWENLRSCDLQLALARRDREGLTRLWFGSPYPALRARIASELDGLPDSYDWNPGEGRPRKLLSIGDELRPGSRPQILFTELTRDFWRPRRLAELHEALHPGESFDPRGTPDRVHQTLRRLRSWLVSSRTPLEIEEIGGFYRLRAARDPVAIRLKAAPIPHESRSERSVDAMLVRLRAKFARQAFAASDAAAAFGVPYRTMARYLAIARQEGQVEQKGAGPATRYSFAEA